MENRALFSEIGIPLSCVALPQCTDLRGMVHFTDVLQGYVTIIVEQLLVPWIEAEEPNGKKKAHCIISPRYIHKCY